MEELPKILEIRTKEELLGLREKEVGHHLEVGDQLGSAVAGDIDILLAIFQKGQEELKDSPDGVKAVICFDGVPEL